MGYYDEISSGYEELHKEEQEKKLAIIRQNLHGRISKDTVLLDVGCGTGVTSDFDCIVYGADPAIRLLEKAKGTKERKKPDFLVCAEAEHLPFRDDSFDVVVSVTAIQNFHDIPKGLDEIRRVGKNKFVLSFLKRSAKRDSIIKEIRKRFDVSKQVEEDKDIILLAEKI